MNVTLNGSMETWLLQQVRNHPGFFEPKPLLLDIGAHHGNFAAACLSKLGASVRKAILFEPNPGNMEVLRERFSANPAVQLELLACDAQSGEHKFFCRGNTETGSLLRYATTSNGPMQEIAVRCVALDDFLEAGKLLNQVGLLKIDTQGNDLRVLQGAPALLRSTRPWIVCEHIFLPMYESQAYPHEIVQYLLQYDYVMGAQFNEFYTQSGWLAWSDACFVPREIIGTVPDGFQSRAAGGCKSCSRRGIFKRIRGQIQRAFRHGRN